jgi:hypothetical protein
MNIIHKEPSFIIKVQQLPLGNYFPLTPWTIINGYMIYILFPYRKNYILIFCNISKSNKETSFHIN